MREDLLNIAPYYSPNKDVINLANNENYQSEFLKKHHLEIYDIAKNISLNTYGPDIHTNLINAYSNYISLPNEYILSAPGSDSLIGLLFQSLTNQNILSVSPDFFRYKEVSRIVKRNIIKLDIFSTIENDLINYTKKNDIEMIILSNPNNPLGIKFNLNKLIKLIESVDCYVVIDEAYWEFSNETLIDYIKKYDNLIILRTLSKAWGLAGLRIGFMIANPKIVEFVYAIQGPFTISPLNAAIGAKALEYVDEMQENVASIIKERKRLEKLLNEFEINFYQSNTNFIFLTIKNATKLKEYLLNKNILVNQFGPSNIRITIGNHKQMNKLLKELETYFLDNHIT